MVTGGFQGGINHWRRTHLQLNDNTMLWSEQVCI